MSENKTKEVKSQARDDQKPILANGKPKGRKEAWEPPDNVRGALGDIVSILFRLRKGERKWVMKELTEALGPSANAKEAISEASNKQKQKPIESGEATKKTKSQWKTAWQASPQWASWQEAIVNDRTPNSAEAAEYESKRQLCFLLRDKLRKEAG